MIKKLNIRDLPIKKGKKIEESFVPINKILEVDGLLIGVPNRNDWSDRKTNITALM